jgi:phage/plasmid primase-like uncharacterized protein
MTSTLSTIDTAKIIRSINLLALLGWTGRKRKAACHGGEWAGPCPMCGGFDRFVVWPNAERPGWYCRGEGRGGDAIALVQAVHHLDFVDACEMLVGKQLVERLFPTATGERIEAADAADEAARTRSARSMWAATVPAAGTVVQRYLATRGITITVPKSMRFASLRHPDGRTYPAMVAAVQRAPERDVVGIHRTFLAPGGEGKADTDPTRMSLGPIAGGAVRLGPSGPVLVVGEGIESCMSVMQEAGIPAWAALSTSGLRNLVLPDLPLAAEVIIAADHDEPGVKAADAAAERWTAEGRRVRIAVPPEAGSDFNDTLIEKAVRP